MTVWDMLHLAGETAIKRAKDGRPDGRSFYLGAVGIRRDGVLVSARNESAEGVTPKVHAEHRLLQKLGFGAKEVYVTRIAKGSKEWAIAKPCPRCQAALFAHKVKKVYFTNGPGEYGCLDINNLELRWKYKL